MKLQFASLILAAVATLGVDSAVGKGPTPKNVEYENAGTVWLSDREFPGFKWNTQKRGAPAKTQSCRVHFMRGGVNEIHPGHYVGGTCYYFFSGEQRTSRDSYEVLYTDPAKKSLRWETAKIVDVTYGKGNKCCKKATGNEGMVFGGDTREGVEQNHVPYYVCRTQLYGATFYGKLLGSDTSQCLFANGSKALGHSTFDVLVDR